MRVLILCAQLVALQLSASDADLFQTSVWPVLNTRCVKCHGAEKVKGGLRLDSREAAIKGGETGPAIVPGKPAESLLIKLVHQAGDEKAMPPKEKLSEAEIKTLEKWILDGAKWTVPAAAAVAAVKEGERLGDAFTDSRNPIVKIFKGERLGLWSLKPPAPVHANSIDELIRAKGGAIAPQAERRALVRRVYFDLIGLPPTPEEMKEALNDTAPDAHSKLIDKLLASPKYGEHWARQWLDAIRYSDSNGYDWDEFRPTAWRFRDYVIRAFNQDKPYDRFIREQLAGDELVAGEPENIEQQDALIATGYLRMGPWDNSAGQFLEAEKTRQQWMYDLVETTGAAFLGLSMSCCRCHDHKIDPLSQEDYYRFKAFFEPLKFKDDLALNLTNELKEIRDFNTKLDARMEEQKKRKAAAFEPAKTKLKAERRAKLPPESIALLDTPEDKRDDAAKKKIKEIEKKLEVSDDDAKKASTDEQKKEAAAADEELKKLKKELKPFMNSLLAVDGEVKPTRVFYQGNIAEAKQEVVPGVPSALDPNPAPPAKCARPKSTGRRTALVDWIVSPKNPFTARVMANRIWQGHFGTGLVATANDFGLAGAKPVNGELLDWLANEFVRGGWSVKNLHRVIMNSAAYKQSAGWKPASPEPAGKPALPVRRLSAEQLRDAMLSVSGLLKEKSGGAPVWPALPAEILKANPAFLDDNETKTKGWYPSPPEQQNVRGIYLVQKRTVRVSFLETFDLPENSVSCPKRNTSTVAPQALTLLNNTFTIDCAKAFAARIEKESGTDIHAQITRIFELALQRAPDESELNSCEKFRETRSLVELCRAVLNLNEFMYID